MLDNRYDLSLVLANYPADCQPTAATRVISSEGFSGSCIWRLSTERGPLCLRQWPAEHPDRDQLSWIHGVLERVYRAGFHLLPVPIRTDLAGSWVAHNGRLWQLEPWLTGKGTEIRPPGPRVSPLRVTAAI